MADYRPDADSIVDALSMDMNHLILASLTDTIDGRLQDGFEYTELSDEEQDHLVCMLIQTLSRRSDLFTLDRIQMALGYLEKEQSFSKIATENSRRAEMTDNDWDF